MNLYLLFCIFTCMLSVCLILLVIVKLCPGCLTLAEISTKILMEGRQPFYIHPLNCQRAILRVPSVEWNFWSKDKKELRVENLGNRKITLLVFLREIKTQLLKCLRRAAWGGWLVSSLKGQINLHAMCSLADMAVDYGSCVFWYSSEKSETSPGWLDFFSLYDFVIW